MPRLTPRDLGAISLFVGLLALVAALVLVGNSEGAIVVLAGLAALTGVVSRLEFAARRQDVRADLKERRGTRRLVEQMARNSAEDLQRVTRIETDLAALRSEIRGMRVAQQLMSQTITATRDGVRASGGID
ncbi:hypothetical protein [Microbacterium sp. 2FI]|uniref:hypothetical protein n=1 Tax=Microbacterium sp. 2FI TaxID=2502193 RepID=UPI0010F5C04A|nr:hypothetical protein [Microbacterium sp. 2FI]